MKAVAATLGAIVLVAVIVVGGYLGGWWLREDAVNRESRINNDSYARQVALQEDVIDKYRELTNIEVQLSNATDDQAAPLRAQQTAVLNQMCDSYLQLSGTTSLNPDIVNYAEGSC